MADEADQAIWQRWVEAHGPKLLLFARQQARSEADAQDLVQEAVVECWRRSGQTPPPVAVVFATIQRRAIDRARREDRRARREQAAAPDGSPSWFDPAVEDPELSRVVQAALSALPAEQREVITLKIWGELTFAEIGQVLGISANTAASRYRYGLAALRKLTQQVLT